MHLQVDDLGRGPLHFAILEKDFPLIEALSSIDTLWNADKIGRTPLHLAAASGNEALFALVLAKFPSTLPLEQILQKDKYGRTALHWASRSGLYSALPELISIGCSTTDPDCNAQTPSILAARAASLSCLKLLGTSLLESRDYLGRTVLHWAANAGCPECVNWLLTQLPPVAIIQTDRKNEETPLDLACPHLLEVLANSRYLPAAYTALAQHRHLLSQPDALKSFWASVIESISLIPALHDPKVQGYLQDTFPEALAPIIRRDWELLSPQVQIDLLVFAFPKQMQKTVASWTPQTLDLLLSLQLHLGRGKMSSSLNILRHAEQIGISRKDPTSQAAWEQLIAVIPPAALAAATRHPQLSKTVLHLRHCATKQQARILEALL